MVDTSTIKSRLRISHNLIDGQLSADIDAAKAELRRVGLSQSAVNSNNDPLIDKAIIAYCMWIEASDQKMAEGYEAMWNQWRDELRKTPSYTVESTNG